MAKIVLALYSLGHAGHMQIPLTIPTDQLLVDNIDPKEQFHVHTGQMRPMMPGWWKSLWSCIKHGTTIYMLKMLFYKHV